MSIFLTLAKIALHQPSVNPMEIVTGLVAVVITPRAAGIIATERGKLMASNPSYTQEDLVADVMGYVKHELRHHIGVATDFVFASDDVKHYLHDLAVEMIEDGGN